MPQNSSNFKSTTRASRQHAICAQNTRSTNHGASSGGTGMTTAAMTDDNSAGIISGRKATKRGAVPGRALVIFSCRAVSNTRSNRARLPDIVSPVGPGASTLKPRFSNAIDARWIVSVPIRCFAIVAAVIGCEASRMDEPSGPRSTTCAMTSIP